MGVVGIILVIATILGGLAAVWFFWDKRGELWPFAALTGYRQVRVTVHRAYFTKTNPRVWAYFINVTNLCHDREIEITHVWLTVEPDVYASPPERPLPKRLKPDEAWETWIEERHVPNEFRGSAAFRLGRVRLSTGWTASSKENKDVPHVGHPPGGPVTSFPDEP
jgi:hypothetical protein